MRRVTNPSERGHKTFNTRFVSPFCFIYVYLKVHIAPFSPQKITQTLVCFKNNVYFRKGNNHLLNSNQHL